MTAPGLTIPEALALATRLIAARDLSQARALLKTILTTAPDLPDAVHLMGAAACSSSHVRGNEIGSAAGAEIEEIGSAAALGAVTIGARYWNLGRRSESPAGNAGRIPVFQPEARGPSLSRCHIRG